MHAAIGSRVCLQFASNVIFRPVTGSQHHVIRSLSTSLSLLAEEIINAILPSFLRHIYKEDKNISVSGHIYYTELTTDKADLELKAVSSVIQTLTRCQMKSSETVSLQGWQLIMCNPERCVGVVARECLNWLSDFVKQGPLKCIWSACDTRVSEWELDTKHLNRLHKMVCLMCVKKNLHPS